MALTPEEHAQLFGLNRSVYIDTEQIAVGDGSQGNPYNNLTTAIDYAESIGVKDLVVLADIQLDRKLKNFRVTGVGEPKVDTNLQDLTKSEFAHCKLEGTYTGIIHAQKCVLLNNFELNGLFGACELDGDLFCIDGSEVTLIQCFSVIPATGRPTISMSALGTTKLNVRKQSGGLTVKDCNQLTDKVTVELSEGDLTFDASCNNGEMVARGGCELEDLTTGAVVYDQTIPALVRKAIAVELARILTLPSASEIATAVWAALITNNNIVGSFGEFVQKKLLTFRKFISTK